MGSKSSLKARDRLLLLIAGILVSFLVFGLVFILRGSFRLSEEWTLFVLGSLLYIITTTYLASSLPAFRVRAMRVRACLVVGSVMIGVVICAFFLFFFEFLPLPNRVIPYTISCIVLAPASIIVGERILKRRDP